MSMNAEEGAWLIQRMRVGEGNDNAEASLQNALANGWEPFAVTTTPLGAYTYHLRRFVDWDPYAVAVCGGQMTRELCKCCNRFNPLGFDVDDDMWRRVVPDQFVESVLCIMCFDYFATEVGIAWELPYVWDEDEPASHVTFFPVSGVTHARSRDLGIDLETQIEES